MKSSVSSRTNHRQGFTLIECIFAMAITSLAFISTVSLLFYAKMHNELEQQRARAHQIISERLEIERFQLFTWTQSGSEVTIWDNNTPDNPDDDTKGVMQIIVRDAETGATLNTAPDPAVLVRVEAVLTWAPKIRYPSRTLRESAMTYKAPS